MFVVELATMTVTSSLGRSISQCDQLHYLFFDLIIKVSREAWKNRLSKLGFVPLLEHRFGKIFVVFLDVFDLRAMFVTISKGESHNRITRNLFPRDLMNMVSREVCYCQYGILSIVHASFVCTLQQQRNISFCFPLVKNEIVDERDKSVRCAKESEKLV